MERHTPTQGETQMTRTTFTMADRNVIIAFDCPHTGERKSVEFTNSGSNIFRLNSDGSRSQAFGHLFGSSGEALAFAGSLIGQIKEEWRAYARNAKRELAKY
jgi:hypothetical protein